MKLLDLINGLATKVGKQNEQAIIDLLSRADLANIDIADDVANSINNNLLTIEGAKNNGVVKNHFTALALSPIDELILNSARSFELGDDFITEISGNKNTFDKQNKLVAKIKEAYDGLKAAQGKGGNEKDIEKYTKQINELQAQLSKINDTHVPKTELEKVKKESENAVLDYMLQTKLAGFKYANKDVSTDTNAKLANIILKDALSKGEIVLVNENNNIKLKRANDPSLDYYDQSNKAVSFDDFANKIFADAKILEVNNGGNPAIQPFVPPVYQGQPQAPINTAAVNAAIQASLGDLSQ